MSLAINTNTGALMAKAAASSINKEMETAMERLSTGKRINSAADDAAGIAIASRLTSEIKGTSMAIRNAGDAQALLDTAEGAHEEISNILQRMRELSVQAANGTNSSVDRDNLQVEMNQLRTEVDRIAGSTSWAGQKLLDGATPNALSLATAHTDYADFTFQVGSGTESINAISVSIGAMSAAALGVGGTTSLPTVSVDTDSTSGTVAYSGGTITFGGTWANADVVTLSINGTDYDVTLSTSDAYDIAQQSGVAAKVAAAIIAENIPTVSITDNGDGTLTVNAGASASAPTVTSSVTTAGTLMTMTAATPSSTTGTLTFANDFLVGDVFKTTIQDTDITITATDSDNYDNSASGIAAQMMDAINDQITAGNITGTTVSVAGAVVTVTADKPELANLLNSGTTVNLATDEYVISTSAQTDTSFSEAANVVTVTQGSLAAGESVDITIGDHTLTFTYTTTDYVAGDNSLALQLAAAINDDATIYADGYRASVSANAVTLTRVSPGTVSVNDTTKVLSFSGDFSDGHTVTLDINGTTLSVTAASADGYESTALGMAMLFKAKIEEHTAALYDDMASITIGGTEDAATLTFTAEDFEFSSDSVTNSSAAGGLTVTMSGTTMTIGGTYDSTATGTITIDGRDVTFDLSSGNHAASLSGAAEKIAQAIKDADIDGVSVTDNGDGTITLEKSGGLSLASVASAQLSIEFIDAAIQTLNSQRATVGAVINRLDSTINNLTTSMNNLSAGRGRIEDADFAAETTALAKSQILQQASTAMLAQANASKQNVLTLLQG